MLPATPHIDAARPPGLNAACEAGTDDPAYASVSTISASRVVRPSTTINVRPTRSPATPNTSPAKCSHETYPPIVAPSVTRLPLALATQAPPAARATSPGAPGPRPGAPGVPRRPA